ncbi:hypothetical protein [Persicobacter psychrovividus]|uniref:Uncharacterized protein n=1 Tax=Persicobacter psychrovividus TaxID=387638 RepID=A0ABN6L4U6_9BACT|nr:hypothetical protein PEPS_03980 [Persicobacter psychrovividus]
MKKSLPFFLLLFVIVGLGMSSCNNCSDCGPEQINPTVNVRFKNFADSSEVKVKVIARAKGGEKELAPLDSITSFSLPLDMNNTRASFDLDISVGGKTSPSGTYEMELGYDTASVVDIRNVIRVEASNVQLLDQNRFENVTVTCENDSSTCLSEKTNIDVYFRVF